MNQNVYDFDKAARARYLREKTRKYVLLGAAPSSASCSLVRAFLW